MELFNHGLLLLLFASLSHSLSEQAPIAPQNSFEVPGKNPLLYCQDPKDYILDIYYIDIAPNPPKAGMNLSIEASGYLSQEVKKNSTILLEVKIRVGGGSVPIIKEKMDLCDQLGSVNETCPIKKGNMTFTRNVTLPEEIPKAPYLVLADMYNEDEDRITCVKATVGF